MVVWRVTAEATWDVEQATWDVEQVIQGEGALAVRAISDEPQGRRQIPSRSHSGAEAHALGAIPIRVIEGAVRAMLDAAVLGEPETPGATPAPEEPVMSVVEEAHAAPAMSDAAVLAGPGATPVPERVT